MRLGAAWAALSAAALGAGCVEVATRALPDISGADAFLIVEGPRPQPGQECKSGQWLARGAQIEEAGGWFFPLRPAESEGVTLATYATTTGTTTGLSAQSWCCISASWQADCPADETFVLQDQGEWSAGMPGTAEVKWRKASSSPAPDSEVRSVAAAVIGGVVEVRAVLDSGELLDPRTGARTPGGFVSVTAWRGDFYLLKAGGEVVRRRLRPNAALDDHVVGRVADLPRMLVVAAALAVEGQQALGVVSFSDGKDWVFLGKIAAESPPSLAAVQAEGLLEQRTNAHAVFHGGIPWVLLPHQDAPLIWQPQCAQDPRPCRRPTPNKAIGLHVGPSTDLWLAALRPATVECEGNHEFFKWADDWQSLSLSDLGYPPPLDEGLRCSEELPQLFSLGTERHGRPLSVVVATRGGTDARLEIYDRSICTKRACSAGE